MNMVYLFAMGCVATLFLIVYGAQSLIERIKRELNEQNTGSE